MITIFLSITTLAQHRSMVKVRGERLEWNKDSLLKWEDFQAKPKEAHFASALSDVSFSTEPYQENNKLFVKVIPVFNKYYSWVKVIKVENSLNVLKHEQTHFDLFEVYARKFRKILMSTKIKASKAGEQIGKLSDEYFAMAMKEQDIYDKETDFSRNKEKQEEWNKKVAKELKELEEFSHSIVEVKIK